LGARRALKIVVEQTVMLSQYPLAVTDVDEVPDTKNKNGKTSKYDDSSPKQF
jgi:hypothetical protein